MDNSPITEVGLMDSVEVSEHQRPRIFYGWLMVGIAFFIQAAGVGSQFVTQLFIQPFKDSFQASSALVLFCTSGIMMLVSGLGSPLCAILIKRFSIRTIAFVGVASVGLGYVGIAYSTQLWHIAVIYSLFFSTGALTTFLAGNTLVSNWFVLHRGRAFGIAASGISVVGLVLPPLVTYSMERFGMRNSCLVMASVILSLLPVIWKLIVDYPEQKGLFPDAARAPVDNLDIEVSGKEERWTLLRLMRVGRFWVVLSIVGVYTALVTILTATIMPIGEDFGVSRQAASYLISSSAVSGMLSMILFGPLFDALGQRTMVILSLAIFAIPCVLLIGNPDYSTLMIASIAIGIGWGASTLLQGILPAKNFGREAFAMVFASINTAIVAVYTISLPLFGAAHDVFGSYDYALKGFLAALVGVLLMTYFLPAKVAAK